MMISYLSAPSQSARIDWLFNGDGAVMFRKPQRFCMKSTSPLAHTREHDSAGAVPEQ
jgi:hypothetical protein